MKQRKEEKKKKIRRWCGYRILKNQNKFLKNVKFFWIRVTKVVCVKRREEMCVNETMTTFYRWEEGEKKNYSLLQNMSEWTTESLKPKTGGRFSWVKGRNFCFEIEFVFSCLNRATTMIFLNILGAYLLICLFKYEIEKEEKNHVTQKCWQLSTLRLVDHQIR